MNAKSPKNNQKHTPGPWRATGILQDNGPDIIGVFGPRSASSGFNGFCVAHVAKESDARLIAAAPELLEALRSLVSMYERGYVAGTAPNVGDAFCSGIHEARAIIAKAEGSANV